PRSALHVAQGWPHTTPLRATNPAAVLRDIVYWTRRVAHRRLRSALTKIEPASPIPPPEAGGGVRWTAAGRQGARPPDADGNDDDHGNPSMGGATACGAKAALR